MQTVSETQKRDEIRAALELPPTAQASDVIKAVIDRSGHTVTLLELMQIAQIMDGSVQLYVTDHESGSDQDRDEQRVDLGR